jgi:mannose-6-phosphate isomerase
MNFEEQSLYPIRFKPRLKEKIWGGKSLNRVFGKKASEDKNIGESWEISGISDEVSVVANGFLKGNSLEEIIEIYMGDLVGDEIFEKFGSEFPLLIKLIDACDTLSIQVHPDDELAAERHHAWGKTEMWYILEASDNALIYTGFKHKTSKEEYLGHLGQKTISDLINATPVKAGDVFFIPAGMVHAIGAGVILAEIQQTSDITYRIYDWDRKDESGNSRELHTDLALDAINFDLTDTGLVRRKTIVNQPVEIAECKYFKTNLLRINKPVIKDNSLTDSFIIYICTSGTVDVECYGNSEKITKGETILIPASADEVSLIPAGEVSLLEIMIPTPNK